MSNSGHSGSPGDPTPDYKKYNFTGVPPWPADVGTQPDGMPLHACMGLNACAGADRFGVSGPPGHGPNECAGQGYCATTASHQCHVTNDCRNQGGCGLYGTAEELENPGHNDCKSLGSCAVPINAERFITNGRDGVRGSSVWQRARQVFETKVWPELQKELSQKQKQGEISSAQPLPTTLKAAPAPFTETGPPYIWVSNDNKDRGNMVACGASGMSGAGGCG